MDGFFEWSIGLAFRPARQSQNPGHYIYQAPLFAGVSRFYLVTAADKAALTAFLLPVSKVVFATLLAGFLAVTGLVAAAVISFARTKYPCTSQPSVFAMAIATAAFFMPVAAAVQFYAAWQLRLVVAKLTPARETISCRHRIKVLRESLSRPQFLAAGLLFLANAGLQIFDATLRSRFASASGHFVVPGWAVLLLILAAAFYCALAIFKTRPR
jgi:hypothetical protein